MTLLVYTVIGLAGTWLMYLFYLYVATRAAEGRSAKPLYSQFPMLEATPGKALVYCFSPRCGPCRPMSKDVDRLAAAGAPVFKLDITEHPEISRELGIRATPTLIVIQDGTVARMLLGVRSESFMSALVNSAAP